MANREPQIPGGQEPDEAEGQSFRSSDYFNDPELTAQVFDEIVSELSDLSTESADDKTARTVSNQDDLNFPRAPWVDSAAWSGRDTTSDEMSAGPVAAGTPRDWADDDVILDELDAFQQPDPAFELSRDPARNLGWFLTLFGIVGLFITYLFTGTQLRLAIIALAVMFVGGVALLIWRMPTERSSLDSDGGAQV
jgi:hypothetical protein